MPLFKISGSSLAPIKINAFKKEKDFQFITEKNLEVLFGLKFVCSEFQVGNFRLDTVGFDEETNSFVIIEYKKDQSFSIIDQGFAYLALMLNHKPDFVLKYNESIGTSSIKKDFDWSQSKIMFLSPSFTTYQIEALNFKDLPIELWEAHLYANDTLHYEKIKAQGATASLNIISSKNKVLEKVSTEIKVFTEDNLLDEAEQEVRDAYKLIKNIVYQANPDVEEKIMKTMVCFYAGGKGLMWLQPNKKSVTIYLRKSKYIDKDGQAIPAGWGGYPALCLQTNEIDHVFIRKLIEQANNSK
ncbi:MAG TPA: hypothetical protein DCP47_00230 [Phycisphaerales bacterium]|nr:hypothetical protein [Phycisphaerales bacterium]